MSVWPWRRPTVGVYLAVFEFGQLWFGFWGASAETMAGKHYGAGTKMRRLHFTPEAECPLGHRSWCGLRRICQ